MIRTIVIIGDNHSFGNLIQEGRGAPQNGVSFDGRFMTNDAIHAVS